MSKTYKKRFGDRKDGRRIRTLHPMEYVSPYIMVENPEMKAKQALKASKAMMKGNKWRLFCLSFSFIGWDILAALSFALELE